LTSQGHSIGENYIFLAISKQGKVDGRFEFHEDDLRKKLGLDLHAGGPEALQTNIDNSASTVQDYILKHFSMSGDGKPIGINFTKQGLMTEGSHYAQYYFETTLEPIPNVLSFRHEMMYEDDRLHRGLLVLSYNPVTDTEYGEESVAMIFNPAQEEQSLDLREPIPDLLRPRDFVAQGIHHIWIGIDHILFLVVLLLPAVLRRTNGRWLPVESFGKAILQVATIVTIFTVAHSITLGLAALNFISLPSRLVESIIALSIILVAANNIFPKLKGGPALVIFGFGLFHGMGFASVMGDIPFRMENLVKVLVAFNVGVEIGQLAIVIVVFALLFALRKMTFYQTVFLRIGSAAAGLVAVFWFIERAFGL
jgi:hypothetical protein